MTLKPTLVELWDAVRHWLEPLAPGALGAVVAQMWEKGLSWQDRLAQWTVGVLCAAFLAPAIGHVFGWADPLTDAVGFVIGTLAFKAWPPLREAAIAGASGGLRSLPDYLPFRRRAAEPPKIEGEGG